jgi:hypothetical protein
MPADSPGTAEGAASASTHSRDRLTSVAARFQAVVLRRALIIGVLVLLVMVGLFLSNFAVNKALGYWELMFPVFGVACVWHELAGGAAYVKPLWRVLLRQFFHWMFPIVVVRVLFLQHARGEMSADSVALVVLVLLALTCFLAGIHFDNSFVWVSLVLVAAAIVGTEVETYLWLIAVLGAVALALAVLSSVLLRRRGGAADAPSG